MRDVRCAILGRPSCGKSTFVNTVCENKVSIVSSIPQSTLNSVNGAYTDKRGRIIFTDTPGIHIDERKFNTRLIKCAINAIRNADCVLYILDACDEIGKEEEKTAFYAKTSLKPVIVLINKCDIAKSDNIAKKKAFVQNELPSAKVFNGSALNDEGLDEVLIEIFKYGSDVPKDSEEELFSTPWTDSDLEFRIKEEIREAVFENTKAEIPHSVYIEIENMANSAGIISINAIIYTEQNSQKGILIGKGGSCIKAIRQLSQKKLKKIFPSFKVELLLEVKVDKNWKKNKQILDKLNIGK